MRKASLSIALLTSLLLGAPALAAGPQQMPGDFGGEGYCDECDACNCGRHHHHGGLCQRWNQDAGFNCGCNGSYKFPVPPLYTYHWPGMYSQVLMTDYHSPWRFPAIKPYVDEVPPEALGASKTLRRVQQAAAVAAPARPSGSTSFSDHVERSLR